MLEIRRTLQATVKDMFSHLSTVARVETEAMKMVQFTQFNMWTVDGALLM